jgi:hypothetical protein
MAAKLINGVKYVGLMDDNSLKSKSLEDNVYHTLRDIFWNGDSDNCIRANDYNFILTNDTPFEERDENFKYSNVLNDYNSLFTKRLYNWLRLLSGYKNYDSRYSKNSFKNGLFHFEPLSNYEKIDISKYMRYDDWWDQFQELIKQLEEQLLKHMIWEEEDIKIDSNRFAKLECDKF